MLYLGDFAPGSTIYIPFHTFNSSGASVTITGLAVTDVEIYKSGSTTQRASDAGYTLLDTDGIDFDGITGIHGFSVNTADNTDAGFFVAGADYWVVISAITADSQTVNFVAAIFSLNNRAASLSIIDNGTAAAIANGAITLRSGHGVTNTASVLIVLSSGTNAKGKSRIATYSGSGDVFNVSPAWNANGETTPSGTIIYQVYPLPLASSADPIPVDVVKVGGDTQSGSDFKDLIDTGYNPSTHRIAANLKEVNDVPLTGDGSSGNKFGV